MIAKSKRDKKSHGLFFSILILFLFFGMMVFLVFSNWNIDKKRAEMLKTIDNLKTEIKALEEKNAALRQGINEAGKEAYWEEEVREQGYKKPGEEQVVILPPQEGEQQSTTTPKNFWDKIREKLGI